MNIGTLTARHARYRPEHEAVLFEGARLSYRAFEERVNRTANALRGLGIGKGDKVATVLGNRLELLELYWAIAKLGAVIVPLSPLLRGAGLATLLRDADATTIVADRPAAAVLAPLRAALPLGHYLSVDDPPPEGFLSYHELYAAASPHEPPPTPIEPHDPYNIFYSSGTTGLPKGIVHTHAIRAHYGMIFASSYRMSPESRILHVGSLIFNGAFLTLMPAFYLGATYAFTRSFDPVATIELIARERITHIKMVPSQIVALLNAPNCAADKLRSLEMLGSVGAPLHREHKERLRALLPGRFYELYGLTEGFVTILDPSQFERKPESVGVPPPLFEMRIVAANGEEAQPGEVGEIVGRGPILTPGYYGQPEQTAQAIRDGWLFSGDLGYVDDEGFLYLVDRKKDLIISGGVNIYPRDIEEVIVQHPAVREALVFGAPDERWGEAPVAAVILRDGATVESGALRHWINERVAARYQKVREVLIRESFPLNAAGKALKRVLREEYHARYP